MYSLTAASAESQDVPEAMTFAQSALFGDVGRPAPSKSPGHAVPLIPGGADEDEGVAEVARTDGDGCAVGVAGEGGAAAAVGESGCPSAMSAVTATNAVPETGVISPVAGSAGFTGLKPRVAFAFWSSHDGSARNPNDAVGIACAGPNEPSGC
jgi:hypothetical protein